MHQARAGLIGLKAIHAGVPLHGFGYCRKGRFGRDERVVFLHTGGAAALFGYDAVLAGAREMAAE